MTKKQQKTEKKPEQEDRSKEYLEHLQRLQAEFQNYQKRTEIEKMELVQYAKEDLILKLLDVVDNFERAIKAIEKTENKEDIKKGINLIRNQFLSILKEEGVEEITEKEFNPNVHEALAKEPSEEKEDTIIEIFQKGYRLKDKVIRPAKVKLSGGKQNE